MKTAVVLPPLMKLKKRSFIDLYEEFKEVKLKFEEASDILKFDLASKFFSDDEELVNRGNVARTSIVTICSALHDLIKDNMKEPDYYLGPSLGLINAIHYSGSLSLEDCLRMIQSMCRIEEEEFPDNKYGVYFFYNIDTNILLEYMEEYRNQGSILEPCMFGTANQMIVNGDFKSLEKLSTTAAKYGGLGVIVPYGPPSHCSLLKRVQERFELEFGPSLHPKVPSKPLISNVTARELSKPSEIKEELITQYTSPVLWYKSLQYIYSQGVDHLTLVGPGSFVAKSLNFTDIPFNIESLLTSEEINKKLVTA